MKPWQLLDEEIIAGDGRLQLFRRDAEYSIRIDRAELMNSRMHASEDALARLACAALEFDRPRLLIGGLGMGYTLAEALRCLPPRITDEEQHATVTVVELVAAVVRWNETHLGEPSGHPLLDPRVRVQTGDVLSAIKSAHDSYDGILLDVDNGPEALSHPGNAGLYSTAGLRAAHRALRAGGVLAVWSAAPNVAFRQRIAGAGFDVEETPVRAHRGRGARHVIWVATRRGGR